MLKDYTATKITMYFAVKTADEGYDSYESNKTTTNLNPKTIRGYIHPVSREQLVYKQYGLSNIGAVEVICDEKYISWFKTANKITINSANYSVLSVSNDAGSNNSPKNNVFMKRAFKMAKIVLTQED